MNNKFFTFFNCVFFLVISLVAVSSNAASARLTWAEAFEITLPEPARNIVLSPQTDVQSWLLQHGLENASVTKLGRRHLVEVAMSTETWEARKQTLCGDSSVVSCESATCAGIKLNGDVQSGSQYSANSVQARLVKNTPEDLPEKPDEEGEAGTCSGAPVALLLDSADAAAQNFNLDLSALDNAGQRQNSIEKPGEVSNQTEPFQSSSDSGSKNPPNKRGLEYHLNANFNSAGGVSLGSEQLPSDTSDWTMVVGAGCTEVRVPLDSLEPAKVPGRAVALVEKNAAQNIADSHGFSLMRSVELQTTGQTLAVFGSATDLVSMLAALALDSRASAPQAEYIYRTTAEELPILENSVTLDVPPIVEPGYYHNDPFAPLTYGPELTGALKLHPTTGGSGQLIAVIDTGMDVDHPELAGRIYGKPINVTEYEWSADSHGTAVAGIIAANANNDLGIYGVAPNAQILAIKACQPKTEGGMSARCRTSALIKAIDIAITQDAKIINMSLSGPPDKLLAQYVSLAVQQGRLIVAGAGNGGPQAKPGFPAALSGVLAVTAVDAANNLYEQATQGDYIDVAAPGVDIVSPVPGGQYPSLSGTSMAAAHATGIAALLLELVPSLDAQGIAQLLKNNVRDLGMMGRDNRFGTGLLDACRAAEQAIMQSGSDKQLVGCPLEPQQPNQFVSLPGESL